MRVISPLGLSLPLTTRTSRSGSIPLEHTVHPHTTTARPAKPPRHRQPHLPRPTKAPNYDFRTPLHHKGDFQVKGAKLNQMNKITHTSQAPCCAVDDNAHFVTVHTTVRSQPLFERAAHPKSPFFNGLIMKEKSDPGVNEEIKKPIMDLSLG